MFKDRLKSPDFVLRYEYLRKEIKESYENLPYDLINQVLEGNYDILNSSSIECLCCSLEIGVNRVLEACSVPRSDRERLLQQMKDDEFVAPGPEDFILDNYLIDEILSGLN